MCKGKVADADHVQDGNKITYFSRIIPYSRKISKDKLNCHGWVETEHFAEKTLN